MVPYIVKKITHFCMNHTRRGFAR